MAEIVKITDYDTINIPLLIAQFQDSTKVQDTIKAFNAEIENLENGVFEVRDLYWLDTAEGTQLDIIAEYFNLEREGRNDSDFRAFIKSWITNIQGSGEAETIITAVRILYNPDSIIYRLEAPGKYYLFAWDSGADTVSDIDRGVLETISPAGVLPLVLEPLYFGDAASSADYTPISLGTTSLDITDDFLYKVY